MDGLPQDPRRLGVISDTHGLLRPEALRALEGVDAIVHAGDIGGRDVLARLEAIAPLIAVPGNNDNEGWALRMSEVATFELGPLAGCVIHDLARLDRDSVSEGIELVISGHSHRPSIEQRGHVTYLNPGSAGPRRFTLPVSLALVHLSPEGGFRAEHVHLDLL